MIDQFLGVRLNSLSVHDIDHQRWARAQAKIETLDNFTASHHWLLNFKKCNGVSSRKVTKFVSIREIANMDFIVKAPDDLVAEVTKSIPKYTFDSVFNADQSSFNYEIVLESRFIIHKREKHLCFGKIFAC